MNPDNKSGQVIIEVIISHTEQNIRLKIWHRFNYDKATYDTSTIIGKYA